MGKEVIIDGVKYIPECEQKTIKLGPIVDNRVGLYQCYGCHIEVSKSVRCIIEIDGDENYVIVKGKHNVIRDRTVYPKRG